MTVIHGLRERSELDVGGGELARVARGKFDRFSLKSTFPTPNRPHRKAPLRGGSLRSARYARARYARHSRRVASLDTRNA